MDGVHVYPDGVKVRCSWTWDGHPRVRFDADAPLPLIYDGLPWGGCYPHGQIVDGTHWIVVQGNRPDGREATLRISRTGQIVAMEPQGGVWPLWMMPSGHVLRPDPSGGTQGFLWVEPDGTAVYSDQSRASIWAPANPAKARPEAVCIYEPFAPSAWDWQIGQDTTPGTSRVIAYRKSTDDLFVVLNTVTPIRPRGAQLADGSYVAAISGDGVFPVSSAFTPWFKPEPPPIVVVPDPPPVIVVPPEPEPEPPPVVIVVPPPQEPEPPPPPPRRPWWRVLLDYWFGGI